MVRQRDLGAAARRNSIGVKNCREPDEITSVNMLELVKDVFLCLDKKISKKSLNFGN